MDLTEIKKQFEELLTGTTAKELEMDENIHSELQKWISGEAAIRKRIESDIEAWAKPKSQRESDKGLHTAANQNNPDKQFKK